ncbi:MAG: phosphoribosylanthranilate isomerase [Geitlerinemataceae cyanobacterium]
MRIKICGITQLEQGRSIVQLGANALGFICVSASPRYVTPDAIQTIIKGLAPHNPTLIGVFANSSAEEICHIVAQTGLTGVQLHGGESPEFCQQLRQSLTGIELIKALRIRSPEDLTTVERYKDFVDTVLLDAYHPQQLGGTGQTLDWSSLTSFRPPLPWFLAGGLNPDNIKLALAQIHPDGIDLSSGVERSPGHKDLRLVERLFAAL